MSTDSDNDAGSGVLSATYRELAVEKTPPALDEAILEMAKTGRSAHAPAGNLFLRWTRPLAWAATIGLSLAIVLEVSRQSPNVGYDHAAEPETPALQESAQDNAPIRRQSEERQSLSGSESDGGASADRNLEALQYVNPVTIEPKIQADASAAPGAPVLPDTAGVGCHRDTRASSELWLECIRRLRRDGNTDLATSEYTEYLKRFPDKVETPATE